MKVMLKVGGILVVPIEDQVKNSPRYSLVLSISISYYLVDDLT